MASRWDNVLETFGITSDQLVVTKEVTRGHCEPTRVSIEGAVINGPSGFRGGKKPMGKLSYKDVIFNDPATIVLWEDGTKTVVKCDKYDTYDPITGLALCFMKKALGNSSRKLNDVLHEFGL